MRELLDALERWRGRGERVAVATVAATRRSAPRPVGSKLAVSEAGEMAGSVSGGCVENEVYEHARQVLAGAPPRLLTYGISDEQALTVGLPCGGEIDVFVEAPDEAVLAELAAAARDESPLASLTWLDGDAAGRKQLLPGGDPRFTHTGVVELEGERVLVEVFGPPPRLVVFGAVDTAEELCRAAKRIGWRTVVVDARAKFATRERLPSADEIVVAWPEDAFARLTPDRDAAVVVLTHEDRFDIPTLREALASEAFYVGALGSRRNQARRRERLLEAGIEEEALERIAGPCGLDIGAHTPAETALSILAEILAVRAGRSGGRLKEAAGRIHAEV